MHFFYGLQQNFAKLLSLYFTHLLQVKWLLHDEIVSNLREISPIQTDTLNLVARHIHTSSGLGKANVNVDSVPLQFVFGQEQSKDKFTEVWNIKSILCLHYI